MNIQQFVGESMRDALAQVRAALGPDALILESKDTDTGFEVMAVAESDPEQLAAALGAVATPDPGPDRAAAAGPDRADVAAQDRTDVAALDRAAAAAHEDLSETRRLIAAAARELAKTHDVGIVREEMQSIRCLVESHLARAGWSETALGSPGKANVMRNLSSLGLAPDVVRGLVASIDTTTLVGQSWAAPMNALMAALTFVRGADLPTSGIVAVVGPTGAGKTTTVAKLAVQYVESRSTAGLAIVTLDNHRLGASEQIEIVGRLSGVPVLRPEGDRGIRDVAALIEDKDLVLVDTVGMGQHDARLAGQLARLRLEERDVTTLLALPANVEHDAMQEILEAYRIYEPSGCVLTKIDESATLGGAFSVLIRAGLPLVYVSDGQRIPEDLHSAEPRRAWLIKRAIEMMRTRKFTVSERYMAESFCGIAAERSA